MDAFERLEQTTAEGGPDAVFELLAREALEARDYRTLFRARSMQARLHAGLPLIETGPPGEMQPEIQNRYEQALREAARETGRLFLDAGDIAAAWPYFRAIGEPAPVAEAIQQCSAPENLDSLIEIAFREQVHPRKGFELILEHRGICNAITWFGALPEGEARRECLRLLVRNLYEELTASIRRHIEQNEGTVPEAQTVAELIAGRDWIFEGNNYHVDTTHIASVLRFSVDLEDVPTLRMAAEMAAYGDRLAEMYHYRGDPPFEDPYADYGAYLRALLGEGVEGAVERFRQKAREGAAAGYPYPVEVYIDLLVRVERFTEAIAAAQELAPDKVFELCQLAGDYSRLKELARERGDLLAFAAGIAQVK